MKKTKKSKEFREYLLGVFLMLSVAGFLHWLFLSKLDVHPTSHAVFGVLIYDNICF